MFKKNKKRRQSNAKYWNKRAEDRQVKLEEMVQGYEEEIMKAYDFANQRLTQDVKTMLDGFMKREGINVLDDITEEQARDFLKGSLDKETVRKLRNSWASQGYDFDEIMKRNEWVADKVKRSEVLHTLAEENMKDVAMKEVDISTRAYRGAIRMADTTRIYDISMRTGFDLGSAVMSPKEVDAILRTNWSGEHFYSRVGWNTETIAEDLKNLFLEREMAGMSTRDIVQHLQDISGKGKHQASRLIRTEANAMRTMTEQEDAERLGIDKYIIIATLDLKTSAICRKQDLKIYEWSKMEIGVNAPPFHPHCRTIASDYFDEWTDLSKIKRIARNPETGKTYQVNADMNYTEWAKYWGIDKQ